MTVLGDILAAQLKLLPKTLQEFIAAPQLQTSFHEIGTKHNLRVDEMDAVANESMYVLLGIHTPSEFSQRLEKEVSRLSRDEINVLVADIDSRVFSPVRDDITRARSETTTEEQESLETTSNSSTHAKRTMGKDLMNAKVRATVQTPVEKKTVSAPPPYKSDGYRGSDPYREPIEEK